MTKPIKLFLPKEFYDELLYQYEGKDSDLKQLVHGFLKPFAKQGKMALLHNNMQVSVIKNNTEVFELKTLKEINLDSIVINHDENWIPEKLEKETSQIYTLSVSDRLYDDLLVFAKLYYFRTTVWNESIKNDENNIKFKIADIPACFEQIIQDVTIQNLTKAVEDNIDKEYDEDFTELNTPKKKE